MILLGIVLAKRSHDDDDDDSWVSVWLAADNAMDLSLPRSPVARRCGRAGDAVELDVRWSSIMLVSLWRITAIQFVPALADIFQPSAGPS